MIKLEPLGDAAVSAITNDLVGVAAGRDILEAAESANGNPSLLIDLLLGLRDEGLLSVSRPAQSKHSEFALPRALLEATSRSAVPSSRGQAQECATTAAAFRTAIFNSRHRRGAKDGGVKRSRRR